MSRLVEVTWAPKTHPIDRVERALNGIGGELWGNSLVPTVHELEVPIHPGASNREGKAAEVVAEVARRLTAGVLQDQVTGVSLDGDNVRITVAKFGR